MGSKILKKISTAERGITENFEPAFIYLISLPPHIIIVIILPINQ